MALDLSRVPDIEYSALQVLMEGEKRRDRARRGRLAGRVEPRVLEVVRNAGLAERLGRERMLFNARAAIERYQAMQAVAHGAAPSRADPSRPTTPRVESTKSGRCGTNTGCRGHALVTRVVHYRFHAKTTDLLIEVCVCLTQGFSGDLEHTVKWPIHFHDKKYGATNRQRANE